MTPQDDLRPHLWLRLQPTTYYLLPTFSGERRTMIYMGLGNSGSKLLWNFHEFLFQPNALPEALPRVVNSRFLIGDADTNNSVIHEVLGRKLHQAHPPQ